LLIEKWKRSAAEAAMRFVKKGMVVGLGSGSTVAHFIEVLGERMPNALFVPGSSSTQRLASEKGLTLVSLNDFQKLDLVVDGADEVDPDFNMIKGGGGAHTREKILASAAEKVIIIVDRTKLAHRLGENKPLPVEVLPFAHKFVASELTRLNGKPKLRMGPHGEPFVTDNGNYVLDVRFKRILRPEKLEERVNSIPGVVDNGLFVGLADVLLVGHEGGCTALKTKRDFLNFISIH
jgi:ribose 5-phosphate isomerase A